MITVSSTSTKGLFNFQYTFSNKSKYLLNKQKKYYMENAEMFLVMFVLKRVIVWLDEWTLNILKYELKIKLKWNVLSL